MCSLLHTKQWCRARAIHYSSCTAVSVIVHVPTAVLVVAHLGMLLSEHKVIQ